MKKNSEPLRIDVEQLIASKNPKLLRWIPKFVINYLKRVIHQDEVNDFIMRNHLKKNQEFCKAIVDEFKLNVSIQGIENIPKSGKVTVVMNHPLGGMDAMAFVNELANYRTDIKFIVNDLLLNLDGLREMFVGVNKHGKNSISSRKEVTKLFETDQMICIFPAGLVSRRQHGKIEDLEWKKTFVTMSRDFDRTVVPVHIDGRLTSFFYNLANFRTKVGIKANIEMLYLVDELYKQKGKNIQFTVGKSISSRIFDKSKSDKKWAEWMRKEVYQLQN